MAIVQNPITGRTKKKFGSAVFSKQFGKNTMRTKPIEVKNPRTPDQVNQRSKFSLIIETSREILGLIRVSFKSAANGMSAFNAFISINIKNAITGTPGNYAIDFPNLLVSKGTLLKTPSITGSSDVAGKIKRVWAPPIDPLDPINDDLLACVAYNIDKKQWVHEFSTTKRITGTYQQTVPAAWSGDDVHTYSFFVSPDKSKSTDGLYSGLVTVL